MTVAHTTAVFMTLPGSFRPQAWFRSQLSDETRYTMGQPIPKKTAAVAMK